MADNAGGARLEQAIALVLLEGGWCWDRSWGTTRLGRNMEPFLQSLHAFVLPRSVFTAYHARLRSPGRTAVSCMPYDPVKRRTPPAAEPLERDAREVVQKKEGTRRCAANRQHRSLQEGNDLLAISNDLLQEGLHDGIVSDIHAGDRTECGQSLEISRECGGCTGCAQRTHPLLSPSAFVRFRARRGAQSELFAEDIMCVVRCSR